MIAKPDSSTSTTTPSGTPNAAAAETEVGPLSPTELYQLTLYKWRYSLEAFGFDAAQVRQLMFLKWLHASRHVVP